MPSQEKFIETINTFPAAAYNKLKEIVLTDGFCGLILADDAEALSRILKVSSDQLMLDLIPLARLYARPPISNYHVGSIGRGLSGNLYLGGNLEFIGEALNFTVHGEQAAVLNAWLHGESGLSALAVNGTPCGHCRQFLNELVTASELRLVGPPGGPIPLATALPNGFGPHSLGYEGGLMQREDHQLHLTKPSEEPLVLAALEAANQSYAPYSKNYAGAALLSNSGQIYAAPYAESVAFNPSVSPLIAALVSMNMCGQPLDGIQQAVLVEVDAPPCSQVGVSKAILQTMAAGVDLIVEYAQ